jgi:DNA processing protein
MLVSRSAALIFLKHLIVVVKNLSETNLPHLNARMIKAQGNSKSTTNDIHLLSQSLFRLSHLGKQKNPHLLSRRFRGGLFLEETFRSEALLWQEKALAVLDKCEQLGLKMITLGSGAFPPLLEKLSDPPKALFVQGEISALFRPSLAMIGARDAPSRALEGFSRLSRDVAGFGLSIVSGLAAGMDGAAHKGALAAGGTTVAVVGCGLDRVYPPVHRDLVREILDGGGTLVSEYPPGDPPEGWHFPFRNRIIAGLSAGVVCGVHGRFSGTSVTVRVAIEENRDLFVFFDETAGGVLDGPLRLLEQGARRVRDAEEIILGLGGVVSAGDPGNF